MRNTSNKLKTLEELRKLEQQQQDKILHRSLSIHLGLSPICGADIKDVKEKSTIPAKYFLGIQIKKPINLIYTYECCSNNSKHYKKYIGHVDDKGHYYDDDLGTYI